MVKPLQKKPKLDVNCLANYRPVSNLAFLLKVFEKEVSYQLLKYLPSSNLFELLQSALQAKQSTETALTKMVNDAVTGCRLRLNICSLVVRPFFETVEHHILLDRHKKYFANSRC